MLNSEYATIKNNTNILSKKTQKNIFKDLYKSSNEFEVQKIYERALEEYFNIKVEHPFDCDGYLECMLENDEGKKAKLMLITEYKFDKNLRLLSWSVFDTLQILLFFSFPTVNVQV